MLSERSLCFRENARQPLLADEHHDRQLRLSPACVAEELVNGVTEALDARPELALADEQVAPFMPDQDVRLPLVVKRLGVRASGVVGVQRADERLPPVLLAHSGVGAWTLLHLQRLHTNDAEDVLKNAFVKDRLELAAGGSSSSRTPTPPTSRRRRSRRSSTER